MTIAEPTIQADGSTYLSFTFTEPTARQQLTGDAYLQRDGDYASMLVVLTPLIQVDALGARSSIALLRSTDTARTQGVGRAPRSCILWGTASMLGDNDIMSLGGLRCAE